MDNRPIIPYAPLIYWSKHWICFTYTYPKWNETQRRQRVTEMCENKKIHEDNVYEHIVNMYLNIIDFFKQNKISGLGFNPDFRLFMSDISYYKRNENISVEEATIRVIEDNLFKIEINDAQFRIEPLEYYVGCGFTSSPHRRDAYFYYELCQQDFNEIWKDVLTYIPPIKHKQEIPKTFILNQQTRF